MKALSSSLPRHGRRIQLALLFAAVLFVIMFATMAFVLLIILFAYRMDLYHPSQDHPWPILLLFGLSSLVVGTVLAAVASRIPLSPVRRIGAFADAIADGDFDARIALSGPAELQEIGNKLNHMAEELAGTNILRADFINDFSHEFKTPIVSIHGFAAMLRRDDLTDEERREYLNIIIEQADRLSQLSTNVLALSTVEGQSIVTDRERYDASEQIRQTIALLDTRWASKRLEPELDGGEVYVNANRDMLEQVWINLLDNAMKFSPQGGTVRIRTVRGYDYARFTFTNDGESIPPKDIDRIFDKFYQSDSSHGTKGNGLGLTIARRIVELHGGAIAATSEAGHGTTFTVTLPAA